MIAGDRRRLVVMPAFNEQDCVFDVARSVIDAGYDCLVVDDASTDRTAELATSAGAVVVSLPINLGVGGALRAGFRYAVTHGYDAIVQIDADGQHPPEFVAVLLDELERSDLDMVIGSRFVDGGSHGGMSSLRRASIRVLSRALRVSGNVTITDPTSGLRAIRAPLLVHFSHEFPHHYLGDTFEAALVAGRRGYRLGEVAVTMRARQGGRPSADGVGLARAMIRALTIVVVGVSFDVPEREQSKPD